MLRARFSTAFLLGLAFFSQSSATSCSQTPQNNICGVLCSQVESLAQLSNYSQVACEGFCLETTAGINSNCAQDYCEFFGADTLEGLKAGYSSGDAVRGYAITAHAITEFLETGHDHDWLQSQFSKDFGNFPACRNDPDREFCISKTQLPGGGFGGISAGPFAWCIPQSCKSSDVNQLNSFLEAYIFANILPPEALRSMNTTSPETRCGLVQKKIGTGAIIMITICSLLGAALIFGTCYDYYVNYRDKDYDELNDEGESGRKAVRNSSMKEKLILSFSVIGTLQSFLQLRTGLNTDSMDGVRSFSMAWVVLGHTAVWPVYRNWGPGQTIDTWGPGYQDLGELVPFPGSNVKDAVQSTWTGQVFQSAEFSVDSFFMMSGFLASYITLRKLKGSKPIKTIQQAPVLILHRFLRITPLYMFVVWFYVELIPLTMHKTDFSMQEVVDACHENWWYNLLYIQTVFTNRDVGGCYGVTWYLADDMMFFYTMPFILAAYLWRKSAGYLLPAALSVASIAYSWWAAKKYEWRFQTYLVSDYQADYYGPPWTRCPAYYIGVIFGMFYLDWNRNKWKIPEQYKTAIVTGLVFVICGIFFGTVYGCHGAYQTDKQWSNDDEAAYIALSKPAWSIGVAMMLFLCFEGEGGLINDFLSILPFRYLSKLTFGMYLAHPTVLSLLYYNRVTPLEWSIIAYASRFIFALGGTMLGAFVLHLCVELPCANLSGLLMVVLFPKKRRKKKNVKAEAKAGENLDEKSNRKESEMLRMREDGTPYSKLGSKDSKNLKEKLLKSPSDADAYSEHMKQQNKHRFEGTSAPSTMDFLKRIALDNRNLSFDEGDAFNPGSNLVRDFLENTLAEMGNPYAIQEESGEEVVDSKEKSGFPV
mmetsp:Transcript_27292/g.43913  ORF Transcript_27292/g.43913 Transcript_27292/m.43913 type:complete len:874 (+) Transcript_27292:121-2742(+)